MCGGSFCTRHVMLQQSFGASVYFCDPCGAAYEKKLIGTGPRFLGSTFSEWGAFLLAIVAFVALLPAFYLLLTTPILGILLGGACIIYLGWWYLTR